MVISRTPFRISFFGGGTDYPGWYRRHGGAVLAAAIDKHCYLSCRRLPPFFEHRLRLVYSRIELCRSAEELVHPAGRAVLQELGITHGVEIHHDGDLPARSGMGSSSAFTVGLLHACYALQGRVASKDHLAREAIRIEQEVIRETVGSQDQVLAAYGGFNYVEFRPDGTIGVRPVTLPSARLEMLQDHLMLFYTGVSRIASDVAKTYVQDIEARAAQLRLLRNLVDRALDTLSGNGGLEEFGELLDEAWRAKRSFSSVVSNGLIDAIYERAREAGALGGKVLGAGGGGFVLFFAPLERRAAVREALRDLLHVPFRFDWEGSRVIFYDPDTDYAAAGADRSRTDVRWETDARTGHTG